VNDPSTVDRLRSGDHACVTFSDGAERLDADETPHLRLVVVDVD
jgi:hypothetical protein